MNPYATLCVRRNASAKTIKAAYRKRAMETHPDRSGDPLEFQAVHQAWKLLSDPSRRKHFDETGEDCPDNNHARDLVCDMIARAFGAAMGNLINNGKNPAQEDMVAGIIAVLQNSLKAGQQEQSNLRKAEKALGDAWGRFSVEGNAEENILDAMVQAHLDSTRKQLGKIAENLKVLGEAIAFVQRYKYRRDPAPDVTLRQRGLRSSGQ